MKRRSLIRAAVFAAACVASTAIAAVAQERSQKPAASRPAELPSLKSQRFKGDEPAYEFLPDGRCGQTAFDTYFRRLESFKPAEGARQIISVSHAACREGEGARVTIKLHRGARFYESEELVEDFLLREGEERAVEKLRAHGIEPYVFGLVRRPLAAVRRTLRVEYRTQSIQVAGVEVDEKTVALRIKLRDLSGRKVTALQLDVGRGGESLSMMPLLEREGRPVIDTGETREIHYPLNAVITQRSTGVTKYPDLLVVESALFADGGYEGDALPAATAAAQLEGFRLQTARAFALIDEALAWPDAGTRASLSRLAAKIEALDSNADAEAIEALKRRFGHLTDKQREELSGSVEWGMHGLRGELLAELRPLAGEGATVERLPKFADWLRDKRAKLAQRLARD